MHSGARARQGMAACPRGRTEATGKLRSLCLVRPSAVHLTSLDGSMQKAMMATARLVLVWGSVSAATLLGACGGKVTQGLDDADNSASTESSSDGTGGSDGASIVAAASAANTTAAASGSATTGSATTGSATMGGAATAAATTNGATSTTGSMLPPDWTNGIPPLHTEGRYFKDPFGNVVVLRGVAI